MASSAPRDAHQITNMEEGTQSAEEVLAVIDSLKKQVVVDRFAFVKKRMEGNKQNLSNITNHVCNLSDLRRNTNVVSNDMDVDLLTRRQEDAICTLSSLEISGGEKDSITSLEESSYASSTLLLGNNFVGKSARPIKLPEVPKIPPYTTWVFLDRNQRMAEDQSVVGRRRIYYDQNGGEALICSDSEEELVEDEEEKKEFRQVEDFILRMTIQEAGMSDFVLESLAQCLDRKPGDIKARYEILVKREAADEPLGKGKREFKVEDILLDKDLDAALDSFDNLFCRRCLVFDCRLHGCSQDLVFPAEKQLPWSNLDESAPCGIHCYKMELKQGNNGTVNSQLPHVSEELAQSSGSAEESLSAKKKSHGRCTGKRGKSHESESTSSNARLISESSESEVRPNEDIVSVPLSSSPSKPKLNGRFGIGMRKRVAERDLVCTRKKQIKLLASDSDSVVGGRLWPHDMKLRSNKRIDIKDGISSPQNRITGSPAVRKSKKKASALEDNFSLADINVQNESNCEMVEVPSVTIADTRKEFVDENICKLESSIDQKWKVIEKSLFDKGVEIFGKKSCLIARNLMNGMKTCLEVFQYMNFIENKGNDGAVDGSNSLIEGHHKGTELRRSRFLRRRGRVRRLKYTWKSAGYHSIRKRITDRKDQPCRQYNPCGCQSACGKQCSCLINGTCCEKYCGCPKICKNRFRGCHCAKSQCRSRQCPCFAAGRECDPDVCRNCWVGCGDGSLGIPNQRGDNYECRNMKLLLKQQQRVLLGRSDVSGWGAFLKNTVGKHDYLGEYTGELISHREADKRGKIYDRENSSFLFNLNDQFVLDAYRKGDKLKFANHSPDPNCYAKVIMVAGDHRVGIFAKERIGAGEEIFYDYRYEADRAPAWARKPEASGSKKDDIASSSGRAKKLA